MIQIQNTQININGKVLYAEFYSPLLFIQGEADEYGTLAQVEKTVAQVSGYAEKYIIPAVATLRIRKHLI